MRVSNFSVQVPEGAETNEGHVHMIHGSQYRIILANHHGLRADATLTIDGKDMGTYRVNGYGQLLLERASNDPGKFTFFATDSPEAAAAAVAEVAKEERGLISVTFRPEKPAVAVSPLLSTVAQNSYTKGLTPRGFTSQIGSASPVKTSGITGLTGHSNQQFIEVPSLDYDPDGTTTISIRLVCTAPVRPMQGSPRVLANAVPQAVE